GTDQPVEDPARVAAQAHSQLHARRYGESVNHGCEHRHVHEVRGIGDLPRRPEARIHEQVVSRGHGDEQDVEHERTTAHLLVEHHGTYGKSAEHIPDGDLRSHVDLL